MPEAVEHSCGATPQVCAAAAIVICRAAAPMRRIGSQLRGVAELPPVICPPYCGPTPERTIRTAFQSTSSSSAIIMGNRFRAPCPNSWFFATIVAVPSGAMLMKSAGNNAWSPPGKP